jgi:hypothetical protein
LELLVLQTHGGKAASILLYGRAIRSDVKIHRNGNDMEASLLQQ